MFENMAPRTAFGPRKQVAQGWRQMHNHELHDCELRTSHSSSNIIRL
jgi:hypothetical protein